MQALVEDFLQYLRHERGQAEHTQKTYAGLLKQFVTWAEKQKLTDWKDVELKHLMAFLQHERQRSLANQPKVIHESEFAGSISVRAEPAAARGLIFVTRHNARSGDALVVGSALVGCLRKCASSSEGAMLRSGAAPDPCGPAALIRS